jgi:hypothetical protein
MSPIIIYKHNNCSVFTHGQKYNVSLISVEEAHFTREKVHVLGAGFIFLLRSYLCARAKIDWHNWVTLIQMLEITVVAVILFCSPDKVISRQEKIYL